MSYLLDVNVLIALVDPNHVHHEPAQRWFGRKNNSGWHTCPLTQTAFLRILSKPSYPWPNRTLADVTKLLSQLSQHAHHTFLAASASLLDLQLFNVQEIKGHQQITDTYLLGLAASRGIKFATLDQRISPSSVRAGPATIEIIKA